MSRSIDIRKGGEEEITIIKFGEPDETYQLADYISRSVDGDIEIRISGCGNRVKVYSPEVDDLIKALQKAKELGWY
jgi:hypothetical protein